MPQFKEDTMKFVGLWLDDRSEKAALIGQQKTPQDYMDTFFLDMFMLG